MNAYIEAAKAGKRRKGKKPLLEHLQGNRVGRKDAIHAQCYACDGYGETGKCTVRHCPLWPYSPFREVKS